MAAAPDWPTRDLLSHRATTTPAATAVVDATDGSTWTATAVHAAATRTVVDSPLETLPQSADERPRVGIAARTTPAFVVALYATWRAGAVAVPLATDRPTADRQARLDRLDLDLALDPVGGLFTDVDPDCPIATVEPENRGERTVPEPAPAVARWGPEEPALVLFTSGTTGGPKGVTLTHRNLVASATASAFRLGVERRDRWYCCLPTNHMGGLAPIVRTTLYGTAVVLEPGFEPARTAEGLAEFEATGVSFVPTMLGRLLSAGWTPHDGFRFVLLGGAPASAELLDRAAQADVPVYPTYGTTETASQIATATPADVAENPDTVGSPLVTADVTLVDPATGTPVDTGEVGELVVDGPIVTPGYLDAEADVGEFGFHTGDLARRDDAGRLEVLGRLDDAIQSGGETVHPGRVADALRGLPAVADAAVVGIPDEEWGERVVALAVPAAERAPSSAELRDAIRDRLAPYERPKELALVDALPRTDSGTVDRVAVREHFRE